MNFPSREKRLYDLTSASSSKSKSSQSHKSESMMKIVINFLFEFHRRKNLKCYVCIREIDIVRHFEIS
jgi:hypothetical protein